MISKFKVHGDLLKLIILALRFGDVTQGLTKIVGKN